MKNFLFRSKAVALATLLALPAFAENAPATGAAAASPKFKLTWTLAEQPELPFVMEKLQSAEQRFNSGIGSKEELANLRFQIDEIRRRAPLHLSVQSTGGPLSAFLAAAAESKVSSELTFTLINAGEPADLETMLPPFSLRNANWGTVIGVLRNFLIIQGLDLDVVGGDRGNPSESKSVVCVMRRVQPPQNIKRAPQSEFESFQLGEYITATQTVEVIVEAIRTAWELDPTYDATAVRLKFHPPTKILLVSGPGPAISVARQVIAALGKKKPIL